MEKVLTFNYAKENAQNLCELLTKEKIEFIHYNQDIIIGYVQEANKNITEVIVNKFIVKRTKKRWNDIMKLINSISAPCYKYVYI